MVEAGVKRRQGVGPQYADIVKPLFRHPTSSTFDPPPGQVINRTGNHRRLVPVTRPERHQFEVPRSTGVRRIDKVLMDQENVHRMRTSRTLQKLKLTMKMCDAQTSVFAKIQ